MRMIEMIETASPETRRSLLLTTPVEKAIALGGVDTGNAIAKEHESATITVSMMGLTPLMPMAMGMRRFAVAVLLMIVDNITARTENATTKTNP